MRYITILTFEMIRKGVNSMKTVSKTEMLLKKYKVSQKRFMDYFMEYANDLGEFVMPNTSFKDVISRFDIQGFWSGNAYRIFIIEENGMIDLEYQRRIIG